MIYKTKRMKVNGTTLDQVLKDKNAEEDNADDKDEETEEGQWDEEEAKPATSKNPREEHQFPQYKHVHAVASRL